MLCCGIPPGYTPQGVVDSIAAQPPGSSVGSNVATNSNSFNHQLQSPKQSDSSLGQFVHKSSTNLQNENSQSLTIKIDPPSITHSTVGESKFKEPAADTHSTGSNPSISTLISNNQPIRESNGVSGGTQSDGLTDPINHSQDPGQLSPQPGAGHNQVLASVDYSNAQVSSATSLERGKGPAQTNRLPNIGSNKQDSITITSGNTFPVGNPDILDFGSIGDYLPPDKEFNSEQNPDGTSIHDIAVGQETNPSENNEYPQEIQLSVEPNVPITDSGSISNQDLVNIDHTADSSFQQGQTTIDNSDTEETLDSPSFPILTTVDANKNIPALQTGYLPPPSASLPSNQESSPGQSVVTNNVNTGKRCRIKLILYPITTVDHRLSGLPGGRPVHSSEFSAQVRVIR